MICDSFHIGRRTGTTNYPKGKDTLMMNSKFILKVTSISSARVIGTPCRHKVQVLQMRDSGAVYWNIPSPPTASVQIIGWFSDSLLLHWQAWLSFSGAQKSPVTGLIGGQGRNRTGVDGFAGRSITTLPPGLCKRFQSICSGARYSTIACFTMLCVQWWIL